MAVSNGQGGGMVDELGTLDLEWRDEQLQRVRQVFDSVDATAADAEIRAAIIGQLPDRSTDLVAGIGVFRDLLRVEHRPDRFRRLLKVWAGKVGASVREQRFENAGLWMRALVESPVFAEEFAAEVARARKDLSRNDLLESLVFGLVSKDNPASAGPLLAAWGEPLVEFLVGQMVVDEPIVNRRHIVDHLGMVGRGDVRVLTSRLADPRWFIVRNIATAIGKAGRPTALPALESAMSHEDERVRVEVIRAIGLIKGNEAIPNVIRALADPSPTVRQAAASILRASGSPEVVPAIVDALERGVGGSADDSRRLVEIIAERRGEEVRQSLEHLAGRTFRLGAAKAIKDAAREALKGWNG